MRYRAFPILLILFFFGAGRTEALDWVRLHNLVGQMDYQEAQEYLANDVDQIEQKYIKGLINLKYFNNHNAKLIFEDILVSDPSVYEARWGVAEALKGLHDYDLSEQILGALIDEKKNFAPVIMSSAHLAYLRNSLKEVLALTGRIIRMKSDQVDSETILYAHGLYSAAHGMLTVDAGPLSIAFHGYTSVRHLKIVRKLDPESFIHYFGWGNFYLLAPKVFGGDLKKAEDYYHKVIEMNPNFPDVYVRLAEIYKRQGEMQKYQQFINKALELDPQNPLADDILNLKCEFMCLEKKQRP
ncbi:MAG: tetratricopeptide repeat protein [Candidatus Omnitrophica bacterium]|nr:tetratricopeptide repeat protein [Candidatus Omnitrophota bacterium]